MTERSPLGSRIDDLAEKIAKEALAHQSEEFRLDAFKALSSFFIQDTKLGRVPTDDEGGDVLNMHAMRERIRAAGGEGK